MTSVDQGLTDLHVNAYKQKHMVVICKTTELPKHDMPLITPTNRDQSLPPQTQTSLLQRVLVMPFISYVTGTNLIRNQQFMDTRLNCKIQASWILNSTGEKKHTVVSIDSMSIFHFNSFMNVMKPSYVITGEHDTVPTF